MKRFGNALVLIMAIECAGASLIYTLNRNYKLAVYWLCASVINLIVSTL